MIKKIGVLTSGGDAPGMNAAVRAVVRTGESHGLEVFAIYDGYYGLYHDDIKKITSIDVSGLAGRGGTLLGTARFPEFAEEETRKEAIKNLDKHGIEAIVVIGGDGSYMGAMRLSEMGYPCIGVPGTIDNDAPQTDFTIGFDTALSTIHDSADRLRDTSKSHKRCSVLEVMGRDAGDLALNAGIACGADYTIIPELDYDLDRMIEILKKKREIGKRDFLVVVAEGCEIKNELAAIIEEKTGIETRKTVLGHIQRGGAPTAPDRILAARLASYAVELLVEGKSGRCVGIENNVLVNNDIIQAMKLEHKVDVQLYKLCNEYLNN